MLLKLQNRFFQLLKNFNISYKRYIFNEIDFSDKLIGIIGARGVGKTTLLLQYLKQNYKAGEYLYFSADDMYIINASLYDIAEEFVKLGGKVIAIDEIHRYQNWANEIKTIYDSFPDLIIRLSGSSMLNILNEKFDLSRRLVVSYVKPLSFREFLELYADIKLVKLTFEEILKNHNEISSSFVLENPTLYKLFLKYLQIGYYPFFKEDEEEYKNKLFNASDKIINEDIPSLNKIDYVHLNIFKKIIAKIIYSRLPFMVNINALSKEFGISHPTLQTYLELLDATKLIQAVKKLLKQSQKNQIRF